VRHWQLNEIETPSGTRSPVVLHSGEEGRIVLIGIQAGQELGEHEVREHAFLLVVDGAVQVTAGGDSVEGGAGALFFFEPAERHEVRSARGARVLLMLSPWPGPGHYGDGELPADSG
jgi:quercetin dioxygenase-like cupin family protein